MKKLICLLAFFSFGYVIAHAQNVSITKPAVTTASTGEGEKAAKKETTAKKKESKKDKKKDCSSSDKKECGTTSGRKSCCSHKEE
jgi:hypothetical protein